MRIMTGLEDIYETALVRIAGLDIGWDDLEDAQEIAVKALTASVGGNRLAKIVDAGTKPAEDHGGG